MVRTAAVPVPPLRSYATQRNNKITFTRAACGVRWGPVYDTRNAGRDPTCGAHACVCPIRSGYGGWPAPDARRALALSLAAWREAGEHALRLFVLRLELQRGEDVVFGEVEASELEGCARAIHVEGRHLSAT